MTHPIFHNKKKLSLALIIAGALLLILPPLMTYTGRSGLLESESFCLWSASATVWREGIVRRVPLNWCEWGSIEVKHLMGLGVIAVAAGVFVQFGWNDGAKGKRG